MEIVAKIVGMVYIVSMIARTPMMTSAAVAQLLGVSSRRIRDIARVQGIGHAVRDAAGEIVARSYSAADLERLRPLVSRMRGRPTGQKTAKSSASKKKSSAKNPAKSRVSE